MAKKHSSMRWRMLAHRGNLIISQPCAIPPVARTRAQVLSEWAKHPAIIVMFGFVLTGVLGKFLSDRADQQQRARDAAVKSGDDLRASVDDITQNFAAYYVRAATYVRAVETGAPASDVAAAQADMQSAYYRWSERYAVDSINIEQRYPELTHVVALDTTVDFMRLNMDLVNRCMLDRQIGPASYQERQVGTNQVILCGARNRTKRLLASVSLDRAAQCVQTYGRLLRPDPARDYVPPPPSLLAANTKMVMSHCVMSYVMGIRDTPPVPTSSAPGTLHP